MRTLRLRRNLVKLSLYRHFTNTLIFSVLGKLYVLFLFFYFHNHSWRLEMRRSSNSTPFEVRTSATYSKFKECFKHFVFECTFVEKSLFYDWFYMHREPQSADNPDFSSNLTLHKLQLLHVQHNFCSVMCYTVLIWTMILLTLGNNILFNWPKPVHYVPTDKVNASIHIPIQQMWIDQLRHITIGDVIVV